MIYRLAPKTQGNQLRDPRGFSAGHKCGCNQLFGGFLEVSLLGGCVQTKSFQPQINPTAKGLAFPTELLSPEQPSVTPGVINARIYL